MNDRTAQCWVVIGDDIKACGLTQIKTDGCKTCEVIACAGEDADGWRHMIHLVGMWASEQGCGKLRLVARPGWEKVLRDDGFRRTHVMLDKEI